jgi:hypothetical protein
MTAQEMLAAVKLVDPAATLDDAYWLLWNRTPYPCDRITPVDMTAAALLFTSESAP